MQHETSGKVITKRKLLIIYKMRTKQIKKLTLLFLLIAAGFTATAQPAPALRLMSFNLRNSQAGDGFNCWENRREAVVKMIANEKPDLLGVQEGLIDQIQYMNETCAAYAHIGVGRDDGAKKGEIMAIYYLRERFDLLNSGTVWLSETPDKVSRGWDGACNRTLTWVKLRDKQSNKELFYFNTHLDHKGRVAREEAIKLIVTEIQKIAGRKAAVILGGDMNSSTESPIFEPIAKIMYDARKKAPQTDSKGTFNGFGTAPDTILIDHLFCTKAIKCQRFATLDGNYGVGYISDHYPIVIDFTIR